MNLPPRYGRRSPTDAWPMSMQPLVGRHPLFTQEGPQFSSAAYQHNAPFSKPGPYQSTLPPVQEQQFRSWVAQNRIPFDPNDPGSDYDMRAYWKATGGQPHQQGQHFPDTYKTPFDTTFSGESQYATPDNPFEWRGDTLIDRRNGQVIFGEPPRRRGA